MTGREPAMPSREIIHTYTTIANDHRGNKTSSDYLRICLADVFLILLILDERLSKSSPNLPTALTPSNHRKHQSPNNSKQIPSTTLNPPSQPRKLSRRQRRPIPTPATRRTIPARIPRQIRRTSPIAKRPSRRVRPVVSPIVVRRHRRANHVRYRAHAEIQPVGRAESSVVAPGVPGRQREPVRLREEVEGERVGDVVQGGVGAAWVEIVVLGIANGIVSFPSDPTPTHRSDAVQREGK